MIKLITNLTVLFTLIGLVATFSGVSELPWQTVPCLLTVLFIALAARVGSNHGYNA